MPARDANPNVRISQSQMPSQDDDQSLKTWRRRHSYRGRDGFDSGAFAGSNAVFCRQAFDSIGVIQYRTQSDDAFTGNVVHTSGCNRCTSAWIFEGDAKGRIRLCGGAIHETVDLAMGQKKDWAKGGVQILLMQNERDVDPDWRLPRVPSPSLKPSLAFPRKMFIYDSVMYPFLDRFLPGVTWLSPSTTCAWETRRSTLVERRSSGMAFVLVYYDDVSFEAIQARVTGKDKSRASMGAGQKTPQYIMVKMSIPEYFGWDHTAATFTANVFGSLLVVYSVVFVQLWQVYYAGNFQVAQYNGAARYMELSL
ncbi:unnamed protein product [Hyaloperonospora brassicae]|uniref:Uncharacterized protein n=1 Tax=Hyaloperonospora brassicae TaxID=162125 RepID=A0AAV0TBK3_HYABA|nr:unnamed protein product [Hyaloperonospora brassicae]